ncbi:MAG: hypothetical protein U0531_08115 [Dehalococcoidia bacterium]
MREPPDTATRDDLRAALRARGELGPELEAEVVEAFLARVERAMDERVDARVRERLVGEGIETAGLGSRMMAPVATTLKLGAGLTAVARGIGAAFGGSDGGIIGVCAGLATVTAVSLFGLIAEIHHTETQKELAKERLKRLQPLPPPAPHWAERLLDAVTRLRARA